VKNNLHAYLMQTTLDAIDVLVELDQTMTRLNLKEHLQSSLSNKLPPVQLSIGLDYVSIGFESIV
jgi:hypothetical protein